MNLEVLVISFSKGEFWEKKINKYSKLITIDQYSNPLSRLLIIIKILQKNKIDIVHSQHFFTNIYTYTASKIMGIRGIGAIRSDIKSLELKGNSIWRKISFFLMEELSINSQNAINTAKKMGFNKKIHFIPNVIDLNNVEKIERQNNGTLNILYVGRLIESKRVDIFLNVIRKLLRFHEFSISAKIIGDGEQLSNLKRICQSDNLLFDNVQFLGSLDESELAIHYQKADIFLFCSEYEGTPNVIMEAMSYGLAIVASNVGGIKELIINNYNGFLVSSSDPNDYLKCLIELCNEDDKRSMFGENSIKFLKNNRSTNMLNEYYKKLNVI